MNTKRETLFLSFLTACLAALIGCGGKTTEEETPDKLVIETSVGIGPVRFGLSKDDFVEHFGRPDRIFSGEVTKFLQEAWSSQSMPNSAFRRLDAGRKECSPRA